ncbi:hypothetical protein [uncultured Mailhella sp.]|uniref:hypothetical protein n=1 Tax=uncultured Mailhella sp. TaxID=1981031 RepID=UPI00262A88E1|nr:hypothetical protein [uncultured Mailhella sp.]
MDNGKDYEISRILLFEYDVHLFEQNEFFSEPSWDGTYEKMNDYANNAQTRSILDQRRFKTVRSDAI